MKRLVTLEELQMSTAQVGAFFFYSKQNACRRIKIKPQFYVLQNNLRDVKLRLHIPLKDRRIEKWWCWHNIVFMLGSNDEKTDGAKQRAYLGENLVLATKILQMRPIFQRDCKQNQPRNTQQLLIKNRCGCTH